MLGSTDVRWRAHALVRPGSLSLSHSLALRARSLVRLQEMYIEGKLADLYADMCQHERRMGELSRFEKRLKEVVDRLYYAEQELQQLEGVMQREGYDDVNDLCSDNDLAEMSFWDAVEQRGIEKDFELALRLQKAEEEETVTRGAMGGGGANLLAALQGGTTSPRITTATAATTRTAATIAADSGATLLSKLKAGQPQGDTSGASLLAALKKTGAGDNRSNASGASLLAALNADSRSRPTSMSGSKKKPITFRFGQPLPEEFPVLPPGSRAVSFGRQIDDRPSHGGGGPTLGLMQRTKSRAPDPAKKLYTAEPSDFTGFTKLNGMLLVDNLKTGEREKILNDSDRAATNASRGVSMDKMRAMMAKTAGDAAKLSYCERLMRDGPSKDNYTRKSMEKLKRWVIIDLAANPPPIRRSLARLTHLLTHSPDSFTHSLTRSLASCHCASVIVI